MRIIELSSKESKDGKRNIKVILHEIHKNKLGYNKNGITWLEKYCKKNLDTIKGISITCEFIDEERTEILGHGETGIHDGIPVFENATMIGVLERGYIDDIEIDGKVKRVCIAEGFLDSMRYKNFIDILENKFMKGEVIHGSVEIIGLKENDNKIKYFEGYKDKGRIPTDYRYSGFAILGIEPSDNSSRVIEINNKEETKMDELKNILDEIKAKIDETSACKKRLEENQAAIQSLNETIKKLKEDLAKVENERDELLKRSKETREETNSLKRELSQTKEKELKNELKEALKDFSEEQRDFAKDEIKLFLDNPTDCGISIDDIVNKILAGIGKQVIENSPSKTSEKNSFTAWGEVTEVNKFTDISIF